MSNSSSGGGGIGFCGALGIMFIGLKLAGFIDWPWWNWQTRVSQKHVE